MIIDPERLRSCREPEKQWSLLAHQASITYAIPDIDFCKEKIGTTGLGPNFDEFSIRPGKNAVKPIYSIMNNNPELIDENGRLNLSEVALTNESREILKSNISSSLLEVYEKVQLCLEKSKCM